MSRVDTTSFAQILTGALGQGANMAQSAASLRQRREEAAAQQAMQQQQFAANEQQRAFGNNMDSQRLGLDQLRFQTMTDQIQQQNAQEQEDRMMGAAVGASSGVFNGFLQLSAQQNGGTPAPDDVLRVRKWSEQGINTRALTTLRDAVQKGADLREMKAQAERLGGIVDNMMADPKNEKARPALELIKEMSLDPKTRDTAMREAFGFLQQQQAAQQEQAMQAQRLQLAPIVAGGGQLTPEQSLIVMDDPALRRMQEQATRPAAPDPQRVAALFQRLNAGDTAARAKLIQLGQITPSAAFGGQRDTSEADARRRLDEMWQQATRLNQAAEAIQETNPTRAAEMKAQSRQLQQQVIASQGQSQQTEPVLLSKVDEQRTLESMKQKIKAFRAQNGRAPTEDELIALETQQVGTPQVPR
jgi:hypothetical protein